VLGHWKQLLSAVNNRYLFKEDITCHPGKWTTMERAIQYLREISVQELIYYAMENLQSPIDSGEIQCIWPMWWKSVQHAPSSYINSLAKMGWKAEEVPVVNEVAG